MDLEKKVWSNDSFFASQIQRHIPFLHFWSVLQYQWRKKTKAVRDCTQAENLQKTIQNQQIKPNGQNPQVFH